MFTFTAKVSNQNNVVGGGGGGGGGMQLDFMVDRVTIVSSS